MAPQTISLLASIALATMRFYLLTVALVCAPLAAAAEIQGHRGARGLWPENSLAAFAGVLRLGVDVLELDTVLSKDDVVVVAHDAALNPNLVRNARGAWGSGLLPTFRQINFADLQLLDIGRAKPLSPVAKRFPSQHGVDGERFAQLE